jgi:hypothetical protein
VRNRPIGTKIQFRHPTFMRFLAVFFLEIDVWKGSKDIRTCKTIICTIDSLKKDSEVKILIGCTESEEKKILDFYNQSGYFAAIIVKRPHV